jgi:hypothetical protein
MFNKVIFTIDLGQIYKERMKLYEKDINDVRSTFKNELIQ